MDFESRLFNVIRERILYKYRDLGTVTEDWGYYIEICTLRNARQYIRIFVEKKGHDKPFARMDYESWDEFFEDAI